MINKKSLSINILLVGSILIMSDAMAEDDSNIYRDNYQTTTSNNYYFNQDNTHKSHHKHKNKDKYSSSGFASHQGSGGRAVFIFDPRKHQWAVYNAAGKLLKTGRASGGRSYCPDLHRSCRTPVGVFRVYAREGAGCISSKFPLGEGGARMPYCSYFHHGYAVHGSYEVRSYNASHGCIRIYPAAAKWIQSVLPIGSKVIVRPY